MNPETGVYFKFDNDPSEPPSSMIDTLEGPLHVSEGDWIITGVKNERYPCKNDIFQQTYERVE